MHLRKPKKSFEKPILKSSGLALNLYLVGFMGVGKSTIGRQVAGAMGFEFIDSDSAIEERVGKSVKAIFEQDGEGVFRQLEREFIETGHPDSGCVVACGGGLLIGQGMLELLQARGVVICLFAKAETIHARTSHRDTRPMLNVENPEERIKALLAEREEHYLSAGTSIITDGRRVSEIVKHVRRVYERTAESRALKL